MTEATLAPPTHPTLLDDKVLLGIENGTAHPRESYEQSPSWEGVLHTEHPDLQKV